MDREISRVLINEAAIQERLDTLAAEILRELCGGDLVVVMLLKGALLFTADLCRRLPVPLEIECLNVASYHGGTQSSGTVDFLDRSLPALEGRDVLLIDDILDTGQTLRAVRTALLAEGVRSIRDCVLLAKEKERAHEADYVGFQIKDEFVVGYGLDYDGKYRNLPYIGILDPTS